MKLQLSAGEISKLSSGIKSAGDSVEDAKAVLQALQDFGINPVTWKDVKTLWVSLGWNPSKTEEGGDWSTGVDKVWKTAVEHTGRGYYVFRNAPQTQTETAPLETAPLETAPLETETYKYLFGKCETERLNRKVAGRVVKKNPHMTYDEVLSATNLWFAEWGDRGTCDSYIAKGAPPSAAVLAFWVNQKIRRITYKAALNPVNREFRGLRTQKEMDGRKRTGQKDFLMHGAEKSDPAQEVVWVKSGEDSPASPVFVTRDAHAEENTEAQIVAKVLDICHPRTNGEYSAVWQMTLNGATDEDIAKTLECEESRVAEVRTRVRSSVRSHVGPVIQTAKRILEILAEEPFSTFDEIQERDDEGYTENALCLLLAQNLITESPGRSYCCTKPGRLGLH